jgi:hypothetical protein
MNMHRFNIGYLPFTAPWDICKGLLHNCSDWPISDRCHRFLCHCPGHLGSASALFFRRLQGQSCCLCRTPCSLLHWMLLYESRTVAFHEPCDDTFF